MTGLPKISIVTPCFNMADYIEQTILSVIHQGYSNLEYIVIDGGSTDGTVDIIKKYQDKIAYWVSEPDKGMYDALQKGFEKSTGEVMGWINSDDFLMPGALTAVGMAFQNNVKCRWLTGKIAIADRHGRVEQVHQPFIVSQFQFLSYHHLNSEKNAFVPFGTIQQESTYWRRSLWDEAGSKLDISYSLAADFELWMRFFRYDVLWRSPSLIGCFRKREGQLSHSGISSYFEQTNRCVLAEISVLPGPLRKKLSLWQRIHRFPVLGFLPKLGRFYHSRKYSPQIFG